MESNNHVVMFHSEVSAKQICFLYFIEAVNWRHNRWYTYVNREGLGS